ALSDVYDALRSKRPYKNAYSHEKSVKIICEEKGKHFDPLIVEAFLKREKDFYIISEQMADKVTYL
ncbi:MAG: two-component system response regulator, partial [Candidatus Humimicrobiaceae bacterium]